MKGFNFKKWLQNYQQYNGEKNYEYGGKKGLIEELAGVAGFGNSRNFQYIETLPLIKEEIQEHARNTDYKNYKVTVPTNEEIINLLHEFAFDSMSGNTHLEMVAQQINRIINTYVSQGWDIYPLMEALTRGVREIEQNMKEHNIPQFTNKNITIADGINVGEMTDDYRSLMQTQRALGLLKNAVTYQSPYNEVFNISDKIGKLKTQSDKLANEGNFDEYDKVNTQIEELKSELEKLVAEYDIEFLKSVANNRGQYIKACATKDGKITLFSKEETQQMAGLRELDLIISRQQKLAEKKAKENDDFTI